LEMQKVAQNQQMNWTNLQMLEKQQQMQRDADPYYDMNAREKYATERGWDKILSPEDMIQWTGSGRITPEKPSLPDTFDERNQKMTIAQLVKLNPQQAVEAGLAEEISTMKKQGIGDIVTSAPVFEPEAVPIPGAQTSFDIEQEAKTRQGATLDIRRFIDSNLARNDPSRVREQAKYLYSPEDYKGIWPNENIEKKWDDTDGGYSAQRIDLQRSAQLINEKRYNLFESGQLTQENFDLIGALSSHIKILSDGMGAFVNQEEIIKTINRINKLLVDAEKTQQQKQSPPGRNTGGNVQQFSTKEDAINYVMEKKGWSRPEAEAFVNDYGKQR